MTDWVGRIVDPTLLERLGVDCEAGRTRAADAGIVFPASLRQSFTEYLAAPIRPVRAWEEIRDFLRTCRYDKDETLFGRSDVWLSPAEFERRREGDCEDHALWTWVQFVRLGLDARFMTGHFNTMHAWVVLYGGGEARLYEPTDKRADYVPEGADRLPGYRPLWSVDGKLRFYWHRPDFSP